MFTFDRASRRYRHADTGRFVSSKTIDRVRDEMLDRAGARVDALTEALHSGRMTRDAWWMAMRQEIKQVHIAEYLLGRGGRNAMTPSDWGRIGREIRTQYAYLERFLSEMQAGTLSDQAITARARLYVAGANSGYSRGQAAAWNNVSLPAHPGDGSTVCRRYCRCGWVMGETAEAITATWRLGGSQDKCDDCKRRAREWAPLRFDRVTGERLAA